MRQVPGPSHGHRRTCTNPLSKAASTCNQPRAGYATARQGEAGAALRRANCRVRLHRGTGSCPHSHLPQGPKPMRSRGHTSGHADLRCGRDGSRTLETLDRLTRTGCQSVNWASSPQAGTDAAVAADRVGEAGNYALRPVQAVCLVPLSVHSCGSLGNQCAAPATDGAFGGCHGRGAYRRPPSNKTSRERATAPPVCG
jgi:hypothetical protein